MIGASGRGYSTVDSQNFVWDTGTLSWVKETQPGGGGGGGGPVTIADGADVVEGALADAAVITDANGTVSGKLRGLVKWAFERMPASLGQKTMASSLPVTIASDQSALTVTANAGTNLNTSLLAVESGGNLATLAGTVTSSRAAVNPISGQAGVQGGAGASTAITQRVAIATDANTVVANAGTNLNTSALLLDATFTGRINTQGQKTMSASTPVAIASDQSVIPITKSDTIGTTVALNALNAAATVANAAQGSVSFALAVGTLAATLTPELSYDGGTNWSPTQFVDTSTAAPGIPSNSVVVTNPNPFSAFTLILKGGETDARVRVSAFTSGTANGTMRAVGFSDGHVTSVGVNNPASGQRVILQGRVGGVSQNTDTGLVVTPHISGPTPTAYAKTITYVSVSQGAAGTTVLAAASPSNKHKIIGASIVMDATGTTKFSDGVGDLTGAMSIVTNGGFVWGTSLIPYQQTAVNSPLNLVTTLGAAKGIVQILTEP